MSDLVVWGMNHYHLFDMIGLFIIMIAFIVGMFVTVSGRGIKAKIYYPSVLLVFGLWLGVVSHVEYNDFVEGNVKIAGDISVKMEVGNKFVLAYNSDNKELKGYDLKGKPIYQKNYAVIQRVILCEFDGKTVDYRQCWNMFKDKTKEELIAMSIDNNNIVSYHNPWIN